jgi:hypothetical protein
MDSNFYQKARDLPDDITNVTTDPNLLTVRVPDGPYLTYRDDPTDTPRIPSQQNYYEKLRELVKDKADSSYQNLAIDIADITDRKFMKTISLIALGIISMMYSSFSIKNMSLKQSMII